MSLVGWVADLVTGAIYGAWSNKGIIDANSESIQQLLTGEPMTAEEYSRLYDVRLHNLDNKRHDRKMLKMYDIPGAYVFTNTVTNQSLVGKGEKVFQKVYRQINGHGNPLLYEDIRRGRKFEIRVFCLDRAECDDVGVLERQLREQYENYYAERYAAIRLQQSQEKESKDKKIEPDERDDSSGSTLSCFVICGSFVLILVVSIIVLVII